MIPVCKSTNMIKILLLLLLLLLLSLSSWSSFLLLLDVRCLVMPEIRVPESLNKKLRYREEHSASVVLSWVRVNTTGKCGR